MIIRIENNMTMNIKKMMINIFSKEQKRLKLVEFKLQLGKIIKKLLRIRVKISDFYFV